RTRCGYPGAMHVFTKRNALVGWIVARIARKRLERRLNAIARGSGSGGRRKLVVGAGIVGGVAVALGALVARRSTDADAQPA
ncbi:MAG TPA: hypothetical protein VFJ60_03875, partial [Gaiella sp.]|nr:hypothetical protein [Gaiella sp.]